MDDRERAINDWLAKQGHRANGAGVCEKCWSDAASMYAGGQGPYRSHTDAYYAAMAKSEEDARAAGITVEGGVE